MSHQDFLAAHEETLAEAAARRGTAELITRILCAQAEVITAGNLVGVELADQVVHGVPIMQEREDIERELAVAQIALRNARNAVVAVKAAVERGEHGELAALRHPIA